MVQCCANRMIVDIKDCLIGGCDANWTTADIVDRCEGTLVHSMHRNTINSPERAANEWYSDMSVHSIPTNVAPGIMPHRFHDVSRNWL